MSNAATAVFAFSLPFFVFIMLYVFFNLIVVPYLGKPLVIILLLCSAAADYAMVKLGIVINSDMVRNFAETNLREAVELMTPRAVFYVAVTGLIPALLTAFTEITYAQTRVFQAFPAVNIRNYHPCRSCAADF